MFKKVYLKVLVIILLLAGCSSMPDIYEYQRPSSAGECYEILVDVRDNYDTHMFLLREEKRDGINVGGVYDPARELMIAWDISIKLLGLYVDFESPLNERNLYKSIDIVRQKERSFMTAANKILGMDIIR